MLLIDDILFAPMAGWRFIMNTLIKTAEEQWNDDAPLKERLMELQIALDQGDITEEHYIEEEAAVLRGLREIQERKMAAAGFDPNEAPEEALTGAGVTGTVEANLGWGPGAGADEKKK